MTDNSHAKVGLRVPKTQENPYGWVEVETIDPDTPCLLALPGSDTNSSRKANGFAKMVERIVDKTNIQIYSAEYSLTGRKPETLKKTGLAHFNSAAVMARIDREAVLARHGQENYRFPFIKYVKKEDINYVPQYIQDIYTATIAPRLRDNRGLRASQEKAAQRLAMLPIVTHCNGSTVAFQLEYLMQKDMEQLGFSKQERDFVTRHLCSVNVAPVTPVGISKMTSFKFLSLDDVKAMSVSTLQINYANERKNEHARFMAGMMGVEKEKDVDNKPFSMNFALFRPTSRETIFAVNNIYPQEVQLIPEFQEIEHAFNSYSEEDTMQTPQGRLIHKTYNAVLNRVVKHALANKEHLVKMPDFLKEPEIKPYADIASKNRYSVVTREVKLMKERRNGYE